MPKMNKTTSHGAIDANNICLWSFRTLNDLQIVRVIVMAVSIKRLQIATIENDSMGPINAQ
jgi:hypothetical protein